MIGKVRVTSSGYDPANGKVKDPTLETASLPPVGTRAVHNDDYAKQQGPVWKVTDVDPAGPKPVTLRPIMGHKLNKGVDPYLTKEVTGDEFDQNYQRL